MEGIISEVNKLDDTTLRKQLIIAKIPIGPIVKSTRPIFEKKLVEFRAKQRGVWPEDGQTKTTGTENALSVSSSHKTTTLDGPQTSTPKRTASDSYFVVCIPVVESKPDNAEFVTPSKAVSHLFEDQKEALKLLKKNPGARFKVFRSRKDAESFAGLKENLSTPRSVETKRRVERNIPGSKPSSDSPNEYHSPKSQQYVALRRALIGQDKDKFNELVWNNPRYLISSGDTPTILQEGPRYNAVHICAQKDLVDMCSLVLDTLQNTEFIQLMYPDESDNSVKQRMAHIVDLYLNVPDKGNNETPLHFACKFGKLAMVKYLLSYPMCDPSCKNRYGRTPAEIICSRCHNEAEATKQKIKEALDPPDNEEFYIPVFRTEDNTSPPRIGQPWSPAASESQSEQSHESLRSPIDIDWNVKAFAGPMSPKEASCLYQKWKGRWTGRRDEDTAIQRSDDEKGLERIGRKLSQSVGVPWREFWDFLDEFVDISTSEGLQKLEKHLAAKYQEVQETNQSHLESRDDVVQDLNRQFDIMDIHESSVVNQSKQCPTDTDKNMKRQSEHCENNLEMCNGGNNNIIDHDHGKMDSVVEMDSTDERIQASFNTENVPTSDQSNSSLGIDDLCSTFGSLRLSDHSSISAVSESGEDSKNISSSIEKSSLSSGSSLINVKSGLGEYSNKVSSRIEESSSSSDHSSISAVSGSDEDNRNNSYSVERSGLSNDYSSNIVVSGTGDYRSNSSSSIEESTLSLPDGSISMPENVFTSPEMNDSYSALSSPPPNYRFYIIGDKPTRRDMDVYRALKHTQISDDFSYVKKWKQQIHDVSDDLRSKWPTPQRRLRRSTSHPALPSTPIILTNRIFTFSPSSIRNLSPLQLSYRTSSPDLHLSSPRVTEHSSPLVARLFTE